mmetsp:Transcript_49467/g.122973  ORF Transcript_49467/g.122973 Transcript_49467/m.122973 type:complete len:203 (-) Transcript_49467:841-1449(-)
MMQALPVFPEECERCMCRCCSAAWRAMHLSPFTGLPHGPSLHIRRPVGEACGRLAMRVSATVYHHLPACLPARYWRHLRVGVRLDLLRVVPRIRPRALTPQLSFVGSELVLPRRPTRLESRDRVRQTANARAQLVAAEHQPTEAARLIELLLPALLHVCHTVPQLLQSRRHRHAAQRHRLQLRVELPHRRGVQRAVDARAVE